MSEHFSTEQVEHYLRRRLSPTELLAADDHLQACEACRARVAESAPTEAVVSNLRSDLRTEARHELKHLAYEELVAYVDDEIGESEREIVDSHLAVCSDCKEEMRDLFAFKESLARASLAETGEADAHAPGFRERFLSSVRNAFALSPLQFAGGLAALMLVALAVTLWIVWKSSANKPGAEEIVKIQPSPAMAQTPAQTSISPTPAPPQNNVNASAPTPPPSQRDVQPNVAPNVNRAPRVEPPAPPQSKEVVVALNDGGRRLTLDSNGRIEGLENLSPSEQDAVRSALRTGRAPASSELDGLSSRADGTLMGGAPGSGAPAFDLQSPVAVVSRTDTPTFRWNALEGASQYRVSVYDSGFNKVLASGALTKTEWTAPRPLARGALYSWQVTALVEGKEIQSPVPPAPEARFRVLGREQQESLTRAEKLHAGSHLTLGVLYSRAGLLDDAEREFRALLAANPDSQVAKRLLANIEALKAKK
jgi:anti-sigma factor RsiW